MAASTKPKPPKEHEVQKAIVDALRLCGLTVYETTAYRQKGSSGVDKGIPDLLVHFSVMTGWYLGLEVKRPGPVKWSSHEQKLAWAQGCFYLVQSVEDALEIVHLSAPNVIAAKKIKAVMEGLS